MDSKFSCLGKQTQLKICPNVNLSAVSTDPSVTLKYRKISDECAATWKTRAHPSLRDSTCPNPNSSDPSRSVPHLFLLCAALGVLATPHLLSQTQRGGQKTTPLEDGSYRLIWPSGTAQHLNMSSHYLPVFHYSSSCRFSSWLY